MRYILETFEKYWDTNSSDKAPRWVGTNWKKTWFFVLSHTLKDAFKKVKHVGFLKSDVRNESKWRKCLNLKMNNFCIFSYIFLNQNSNNKGQSYCHLKSNFKVDNYWLSISAQDEHSWMPFLRNEFSKVIILIKQRN